MKTSRKYIISSNTTDHTNPVFGILPIGSGESFDFEAKAIISKITVIKESAFDKTKYPPQTNIAIVECLKREISRQDATTITLRWGGNIAHMTTAGEYDPENRNSWMARFWKALHNP